jgi:hypothetical protein
VVVDKVGAKFDLLYNIDYISGLDSAYLIVDVLHTRRKHHNVCRNMLVLQDLVPRR